MEINMKIARIKKNIKQKDLAEKAGLTTQYLRMLESGKANNPTREVMINIAKELECTVQELFFSEI